MIFFFSATHFLPIRITQSSTGGASSFPTAGGTSSSFPTGGRGWFSLTVAATPHPCNQLSWLLLPCAPPPCADAVGRLRGSTHVHMAPRQRHNLSLLDGGPGRGATVSHRCRPQLRSDSPRVDLSVQGGAPLFAGGGAARLHGGAMLLAVAHGKPGNGSSI